MSFENLPLPLFFSGSDYVIKRDGVRLEKQCRRIYELMKDGKWRTLKKISFITGAPEASASAQLRNLRKQKFGGFTVERRHVERGLFEYRLIA